MLLEVLSRGSLVLYQGLDGSRVEKTIWRRAKLVSSPNDALKFRKFIISRSCGLRVKCKLLMFSFPLWNHWPRETTGETVSVTGSESNNRWEFEQFSHSLDHWWICRDMHGRRSIESASDFLDGVPFKWKNRTSIGGWGIVLGRYSARMSTRSTGRLSQDRASLGSSVEPDIDLARNVSRWTGTTSFEGTISYGIG